MSTPDKNQRSAAPKVILLVVLVALVVVGIVWWQKKSGESNEPPTIRVAYAPVVLNLPSYLAQDRGMFAKKKVPIAFTVFNSANDMINAVVAGQADVVTGVSLVPILNLEAQHPGKVRIILHSKMTSSCPYDGIVVKENSPIKSVSDLAGRKIGLFPGTTALNLMRNFLKKQGVKEAGIEFVQLPPASHLSALESGAVDALLAYEPTLTTALSKGNRRIFGSIYVDMLSPSPISASIVSREFEKKYPDEVKAFTSVLDEAIGSIRASPSEARRSLGNYTKLPPEVIPQVNIVDDVLSTEVDTANLQAFIDRLVELGELPHSINAVDLVKP